MRKVFCYIIMVPILLLSLLPLGVHHAFARILAWLFRRVLKYRLGVVYVNISRAFPELGYKEVDAIVKEYYLFMSDVICETVWSLTRSFDKIRRIGMFSVDNPDELNEALSKGRPVVSFLSHCGNWELIGGVDAYCGKPMNADQYCTSTAYHPMSSKTAEMLFKKLRNIHFKSETCTIPSEKFLRFALERKDSKWLFFFNSDQCPEQRVVFSNTFLGLPTMWVNGGEAIARKLAAPVFYLHIDRPERGRYVIKVHKICEDASLMAKGELMEAYSRLLESEIRANPANWLWSHKRWKNIGK